MGGPVEVAMAASMYDLVAVSAMILVGLVIVCVFWQRGQFLHRG